MGKQMQSVNLSADNQWLTPWEHTAVTKLRRYKWLNQAPRTRWFTPKLIPTNTFFREDLPIQARLCSHCTEWKQGCSISDGGWTQLPNLDFLSVLKSIRFLHFHRAALSKVSTLKTPWYQTTLYCVVSSFENLLWIVSLQNFWRILPEAAALCLAHADKDLPRNLTKTVFITRHSSSDIQQKKPARKNRPNWNSIQHNTGFEEEIVVFSAEIKM